jgi:hypothetical protein
LGGNFGANPPVGFDSRLDDLNVDPLAVRLLVFPVLDGALKGKLLPAFAPDLKPVVPAAFSVDGPGVSEGAAGVSDGAAEVSE